MNWFVHGNIPEGTAVDFVDYYKETASFCEHVETDPSLAVHWSEERDSFGGDGKHIVCKACKELADEEEANTEVVCLDCKQVVLQKDTIEYKWYDFYREQGDEPLIICNNCVGLERHQNRLANDQANIDSDLAEAEQDYNDDADFDEYPEDQEYDE